MKKTLIKNWPAKLASLAAAFVIWYIINQHLNEGVDFKFISEQARDQRKLEEELQRKQLEVSILQDRINQSNIDEAQKAIVIDETQPEPAPQETPPP